MTDKIKNLYKYLIEEDKASVFGWYSSYKLIVSEVDSIKIRLQNGGKINPEADKEFLYKLLFEKSNGIASRGRSILSYDNFYKCIASPSFVEALENIIKEPSNDNYNLFATKWHDVVEQYNPVLVNRVAAACTQDVSTVVDLNKFNLVYNWLKVGNYIDTSDEPEGMNWFERNKFLIGKIKESLGDECDPFYRNIFVWKVYENMSTPFSLKKQIVMYGPPGTGKTFSAGRVMEHSFDVWKEMYGAKLNDVTFETNVETLQFHPSFGYEDFLEGLRPVIDEKDRSKTILRLQNGVFKNLCKKAAKWEIDYHQHKKSDAPSWDELTVQYLFDNKEVFTDELWKFILENGSIPKDTLVSDVIPPFFLIIDEINRAELSRVFGELMYCLEYRGANSAIKTQYAGLNDDETGMLKIANGEYRFFIPSNLFIIGTMNTIDRSVESFDFALRRRFRWQEVLPDSNVIKVHYAEKVYPAEWINVADNFDSLNAAIKNHPLLGPDYMLGHAYFINLKYDETLTLSDLRKRLWLDFINPLLQEYLRGSGQEQSVIDELKKKFGIT